jgi:hypothetical protein
MGCFEPPAANLIERRVKPKLGSDHVASEPALITAKPAL